MAKSSPLTVRELELWERFLPTRALDARNALAENYQPFVHSVALRLKPRLHAVEHDDLVNDGQAGLLNAIDGFNLSLRRKFVSYARPRVRGAMLDGVRRRDRLTRVGRGWQRRIDSANQVASDRLQAPANATDVASELGMSDAALAAIHRSFCVVTRSLSEPLYETDRGIILDLASLQADRREPSPATRLQQQLLQELLLKHCSEIERRILIARYYQDKTFEAIGVELGMSGPGVWKIHRALMATLRRELAGRADEFTSITP